MKMIRKIIRGKGFTIAFVMVLLITVMSADNNMSNNNHISDKLDAYYKEVPEERIYVKTDRPFYEPGDMIWLTAFIRDARTLGPSNISDIVHIELNDPSDETIEGITTVTDGFSGMARGDFLLDEDAPGGIYTIRAYTKWQKEVHEDLIFERNIQVMDANIPDLRMEVDFDREGYGPGSDVDVELQFKTPDNENLSNHDFTFGVEVGGNFLLTEETQTNRNGTGSFAFELPEDLNTTDVFLNVVTEHQGATEQIGRNVPVNLNDMELAFFPEGGDLIAGFEKQLAFAAKDEHGSPVDFKGYIYNSEGPVETIETSHQGRGSVSFRPKPGENYYVKLQEPGNIDEEFELPKVISDAPGLEMAIQSNRDIIFNAYSPESDTLRFHIELRGDSYYEEVFRADSGINRLAFSISDIPPGVARATLFDKHHNPVAERLTYINHPEQMNIDISTNKDQYEPGEEVQVDLQTTNRAGDPVPARLAASVVSDALLSHADDQQGGIMSGLLLDPEVEKLPDNPDKFFKETDQSYEAMEHFLLTSGWRRFEWKDIKGHAFTHDSPAKDKKSLELGFYSKNNDFIPILTGYPDAEWKIEQITEPDTFKIDNQDTILRWNYRLYDKNNLLTQDDQQSVKIGLKGVYIPEDDRAVRFKENIQYENLGDPQEYGARFTMFLEEMEILESEELKSIWDNYEGKFIHADHPDLIGKAWEEDTGEPIPFINIILMKDEQQFKGTETNMDGVFEFNDLEFGVYTLKISSISHINQEVEVFFHSPDIGDTMDIALSRRSVELYEYEVQERRQPLIEVDDALSGRSLDNSDRVNMASLDEENLEQSNQSNEASEADEFGEMKGFEQHFHQLLREDREKRDGRYFRARKYPEFFVEEARSGKDIREDFRPTAHWEGLIETDKNGQASFSFKTTDELNTFRITAEGISKTEGHNIPGRGEATFYNQLPLETRINFPPALTGKDQMVLPLHITNHTKDKFEADVVVSTTGPLKMKESGTNNITIPGESSETQYIPIEAGDVMEPKVGHIRVKVETEEYADEMQDQLNIRPRWFEITRNYTKRALHASFDVTDEHTLEGSMRADLHVSSSVSDQLQGSVASIISKPHGCFEQTTSSNYPNIIAMQLINDQIMEVEADALEKYNDHIAYGHDRLFQFRDEEGAFSWFGRRQNEMRTARAIRQYHEMREVYDEVDMQKVNKSAEWLMSRKEGNGAFRLNGRAASWRNNPEGDLMAQSYIIYALTQAGYKDEIREEIKAGIARADTTSDPYVQGLMAVATYHSGNKTSMETLIGRLAEAQKNNGSWTTERYTMSGSRSRSAYIETTALAVRSLMKSDNEYHEAISDGLDWLLEQQSDRGTFGNTQGTVKALQAIVEGLKNGYIGEPPEDVMVHFSVNEGDRKIEEPLMACKGGNALEMGRKAFKPEGNEIEVAFMDTEVIPPYTVTVHQLSKRPPTDEKAPVELSTNLNKSNPEIGENVRMEVILENIDDDDLSMTMAHIGVPGGLSVRHTELRDMQERGEFDYYELEKNELILYFLDMPEGSSEKLTFNLRTEVPGQYQAPASSAYMYYMDEHKFWTDGEEVEVR